VDSSPEANACAKRRHLTKVDRTTIAKRASGPARTRPLCHMTALPSPPLSSSLTASPSPRATTGRNPQPTSCPAQRGERQRGGGGSARTAVCAWSATARTCVGLAAARRGPCASYPRIPRTQPSPEPAAGLARGRS